MIVKLDKTRLDYQQKLAELRRIVGKLDGEPRRTVICFKTFGEFNQYKQIIRNMRSQVDNNQARH